VKSQRAKELVFAPFACSLRNPFLDLVKMRNRLALDVTKTERSAAFLVLLSGFANTLIPVPRRLDNSANSDQSRREKR
jgi:hypothetical protein